MTERENITLLLQDLYASIVSLEEVVLAVFKYQAKYNRIYRSYLAYLGTNTDAVDSVKKIPFLPIQLFKSHKVITGNWQEETIFRSSGTTSSQRSQHLVRDISGYHSNAQFCFQHFFHSVEEYCYLALLPGYVERQDSSLVSMVDHFINKSKHSKSGFYLDDHKTLHAQLIRNIEENIPTVFFGVSFALLAFVETYKLPANDVIVMETGGMKTRTTTLSKSEIYDRLTKQLGTSKIYSEYGMTELQSQAYALRQNEFKCPATMQVLVSELNDPFHFVENGVQGQLNIVDIANLDTISFIQTEDVGRKHDDMTFEITGRLDISDLRGCNLLLET